MNGTATEFTAAATARLDSYLLQVRAAVATAPDLDPADIEADIRDHVAVEFRAHPRPVALVDLEPVLAALGPPAGWAPAVSGPPAVSVWGLVADVRRRLAGMVAVLWRGPEDWRLAYLCLLLTVLAVPTVGLSLVVAYLLGRAAVALAAERGQPLGARRWLVYPPLVAVALPLFVATTLWPVLAAGAMYVNLIEPAEWHRANVAEVRADGAVRFRPGHEPRGTELWRVGLGRTRDGSYQMSAADRQSHEQIGRALDRMPVPPAAQGLALGVFLGVGLLLAWGLVLGVAFWAFPAWPPAVFFPLLSGYDWLHGVRLAACSGLGLLIWAGYAHRLGVATWV